MLWQNVNSDGGDSGSKQFKGGYGGVCGGVWRSLRLAGVWSHAFGFVLVRLAVAVKMFAHLIYFIRIFHKCHFQR